LTSPVQLRLGALSQAEEIVRVPLAQITVLSRLGKQSHRVLMDRLEHPEPILLAYEHKALVYERLEGVDVGLTDSLRRLDRPGPVEDRKPSEKLPLALVEQVITPRDRGSQCLLAWIDTSRSGEQVQPLRQPLQQLRGREHAHPCCCQLEREWQIVQALTEFRHRVTVGEIWPGGPGAGQKELGSVVRLERRDGIGLLAGKAKQLAARHDKLKSWAVRKEPAKPGRRLENVFEIVEQQQQ